MLHSDKRFILVLVACIYAVCSALMGCARLPAQSARHVDVANDTDDLHAELLRYVEEHRAEARRGFYPDGTRMGPTCIFVTVEACLVDDFLKQRGVVEDVAPTAFDPQTYLLIDVRGETERSEAPLPASLDHRTVQYGFDTHDPLALNDLDRDAFVEAIMDTRGDDSRPVALLCTVGMRSRAAVATLHEAGVHDALSVRGGLSANPSLVSPAS